QGTAADIIKRAMISVDAWLQDEKPAACLIMQVHDELVLETPPDEQAAVISLVRETMENAYRLDVPLKVDVEVGPNWRDLTEA
ncbi:MAG: hypothetical protein KDD77_13730, partial [Caldilineaceae bacterium]|nr:hypothetical protein [Caldilineaceae bacterium]